MNTVAPRIRLTLASTLVVLSLAACGDDEKSADTTLAPATTEAATTTAAPTTDAPTTDAPTTTVEALSLEGELVGTFTLDPGTCDGTTISGSYFKMVGPAGTPEDGPYIPNGDSTCVDTSATALVAGTDGGLITGAFQAPPDPAYDADGNALAAAIFGPTPFFGVKFGGGTDATGATPTIIATDGVLTGDLSAFTAYYGGQSFNQGAPKPDGSGSAPTGTIDPATGKFTLEWTSLIVGGSFDGFTGVWHLEGTFTPAA